MRLALKGIMTYLYFYDDILPSPTLFSGESVVSERVRRVKVKPFAFTYLHFCVCSKR